MDSTSGSSSWIDPMTTHEIDDLDFPPLDSRDSHDPLQRQSKIHMGDPIDDQQPSMFLDPDLLMLDTHTTEQIFGTPIADDQMDLGQSYQPSQAPTTDGRLIGNSNSALISETTNTTDLPAELQDGQILSEYNQSLAQSHAAAEHSTVNQAQKEAPFTPKLNNQELLYEQQMPGRNRKESSSPNAAGRTLSGPSGSGHRVKPRRYRQSRHNTPSRISETGAIKKTAKPEPLVLPPQAARALMVTPGLQKFGHIEDANELPPRIRNRILFQPDKVYLKLDSRPAEWNIFSYNEHGELKAGQIFTVDEVYTYLYHHPLHTLSNGQFDPKKGGLKLWIQRNPSDSKDRYGESCSSRCRFKDCVAENHLIGQGQVRVCWDELSCRGQNLDPFFNAGYVHLWCLERFMDFPKICQTLQVKVEDRILPHEPNCRNKMTLRSVREVEEAERFIRKCEQGKVPSSYPHFKTPNRPYENTLNHRLCVNKIASETPSIRKTREDRGNRRSTLSWHKGDLEMETKHRAASRRTENQIRRKSPPQNHSSEGDSEGGALCPMPKTPIGPMKERNVSPPQALLWPS
ncbi:hypothetical protein G7Y79_00032g066990 [Physcia stellaris]|nr:hypothetical protein G7Y79_00032g066990 [Physcia stellaris]